MCPENRHWFITQAFLAIHFHFNYFLIFLFFPLLFLSDYNAQWLIRNLLGRGALTRSHNSRLKDLSKYRKKNIIPSTPSHLLHFSLVHIIINLSYVMLSPYGHHTIPEIDGIFSRWECKHKVWVEIQLEPGFLIWPSILFFNTFEYWENAASAFDFFPKYVSRRLRQLFSISEACSKS